MKIRVCANSEKPLAGRECKRLRAKAVSLGHAVATDDGAADVVISIGGDGTFLKAVHDFPGIPALGFNVGGLGYLAGVGRRDFDKALKLLSSGQYKISERCLLEVRFGRCAAGYALNDVVVAREASGRAVRLDLAADGRLAARYLADGLIVSTPTGSTAYSLAAGGPVLVPGSGALVVTPANPHALGIRPLVVRDSVRFTVTARRRTRGNGEAQVGVFADGERVMSLEAGKSVDVMKSRKAARIVELEGYDPYEILVRKLGWSGSNVK